MATLHEQLQDTIAAASTQLPSDVAEVFSAQRARLDTLEVPVIAPGTEVPDTAVVTATGEATTLGGVLAGRPAVLVFYRGGWCPYCNTMFRAYRTELAPALRDRGVALVAVSPELPDNSLSTKEKFDLDFDVVSDTANTLAEALGIVDEGSDEVRATQARLGLDLAAHNSGGDARLPHPAVVVLDADRRVRWADVTPNYATRTEPTDILAALDAR